MPDGRSGSDQAPREAPDVGDEDPGHDTLEGALKVFGEALASPEPGDVRSTTRRRRSSSKPLFGGIGSFDDLEAPLSEACHDVAQLVSRVAVIGEHMAQLGLLRADRRQHLGCAITVLDVGGVNPHPD